ncbi:alpha/beta hydrolase [Streptomyces lonegramiae]|uniref:Alpha/beta fold hydrolase n=1 Tax=Streptomyces lonegramiae TaxID=3075524 RepID=A0ABU2XMR3_9ACTN|nr:alpha/beta fold hydrolase [Streptomyces sp. DSM 41529]MDT0546749.1 alpha/beta fold hydrolase [Streptomyces sp. DSM 41529]
MTSAKTGGAPPRRPGGALRAAVAPLLGLAAAAKHAYQLYHPPRPAGPARTPADKGLPTHHKTVVASYDGVPLRAWVVPGAGPHTVVVCHGMGRTKSMTLGHIALLHRAGHHVVAYDMRNHGDSGADRALGRMAERYISDLRDVLYATAADPRLRGGAIALYGFSFSTWPALQVVPRSRVPVAAVIADSGPAYDVPAGLRHFAALRGRTMRRWLRGPLTLAVQGRAFEFFAMRMLGLADWPPDLSAYDTRLMFIGSAEDTFVRPESVERTARHYPGAEYWTAAGAPHMRGVRFDAAEYEKRVLGFLAEAFDASEKAAEVGDHD